VIRVIEPYAYQRIGVDWLSVRKRALLADDCGLGKSLQAIKAAERAGAKSILVICPASVVVNWQREFAKFWPDGPEPEVVSYDRAMRGAVTWPRFDVLILDEAHYLKTPQAKRTKAVFGEKCDGKGGLVERADRVILLTGTPFPNHPAELWPALRALWPEQITGTSGKPYAYWQFVSKFCKTRDNGFGLQIVGAKNHDLLREKLAPVMLRRLKAEVLPDLPEISFDPLYVEGRIGVAGPEAELVREALAKDGVDGLKRVANHVATLRRLTGMAKVEPVVEWVKDFLEGSDRKIVIFCQHTEVIAGVVRGLVDARSRAAVRKVDSSTRTPAAEQRTDVALQMPLRNGEASSSSVAPPGNERGVSFLPGDEARAVAGSSVPALHASQSPREKERGSLRLGLEGDTRSRDLSSARDSASVEQQEDAPQQPVSRSAGAREGVHEGQRLGDQLASERDQTQRVASGVGADRRAAAAAGVVWIDGATSAAERQASIDVFQNDPDFRVFIGQNTAAGTGITLTAASDLILLEAAWVPAENAQIAGRIHRIGQKNGCQVRFATLAGSIDEDIQRAVARKTADISAILDDRNVEI